MRRTHDEEQAWQRFLDWLRQNTDDPRYKLSLRHCDRKLLWDMEQEQIMEAFGNEAVRGES